MNRLIFDTFSDKEKAIEFSLLVTSRFELECSVHDSEESAREVNIVIPVRLVPPIVLVERTAEDQEKTIRLMAKRYGGTFAGT